MNQTVAEHVNGGLGLFEDDVADERPAAYIIILGDTEITKNCGCDHGIAAQSILLGAREQGLAGCMIGLIDRDDLRETLDIPMHYEILLVLALGRPREQIVLEQVPPPATSSTGATPPASTTSPNAP